MICPNWQVSVIVTTYSDRRWDCLVEAVASVSHQTVTPRELIVIVDHNPALLERVRKHLPNVTAAENDHKRGLAGARNTGLALAQSEIVAFLDDDAVALPDWLQNLLPAYSNSQVLGVGGRIDPLWQTSRPEWLPGELDWVIGCSYLGLPDTAAPVRNLIGCNMSFLRNVAVGIGGFRDTLGRVGAAPLGCEETEFCIRLRQMWPDRLLVYQPNARVQHRVPTERGRWGYLARRCYSEGLSKAQVTETVGSAAGLSSERTYVLHTLPVAAGRGLADFALRRGRGGLKRTSVLISGLLLTTGGYCYGRFRYRFPRTEGPRPC